MIICNYCGNELWGHLQVCCGELHNHEYGFTDEEKQEIEQELTEAIQPIPGCKQQESPSFMAARMSNIKL